ncbi:unnamed protein product [Clonostachys rhizophaga]|uniref:Uncharacterized protein n=1 Tax=Clonostachys rhizophaga TaxID=160324 RepID=A0A9N9VUP1_9HYPO|nr:unnamed protein product [Clonostachys rhizophaga]
MRLLQPIALAALAAFTGPAAAADCEPRNPDGIAAGDELIAWIQTAVHEFIPIEDSWSEGFDRAFSTELVATFNATMYNFGSLRGLFGAFHPRILERYAGTFTHGYFSAIGVPHATNRGGNVYLTGWEGGYIGGDVNNVYNATQGSFGVIEEQEDCSLKIVEWRESSNLATTG